MRRAACLILAAMVWLSACGSVAPTSSASASAPKLERADVTAMFGTTSGSSAAMWLAADEGLANKDQVYAVLAKYFKAKPGDAVVADNYRFYHDRLVHDITPEKDGADTALDALKDIDPARYANVSSDVIIDGSFMATIREADFQKKIWGE